MTQRYGFRFTTPPGSDFPDASNTGTSGALTPVSGTLTVSVNGTVVENEERTGNIVIDADNVTVRNCKIICGSGTAILNEPVTNTGLLVEDCEIEITNIHGGGIASKNFIARRCNIYGGENLIQAETNVTVEDCYIHDPAQWNPTDDPHTDGIQVPTFGANLLFQHNTVLSPITLGGNSAIGIAYGGTVDNVQVINNLMAGGGYTLYGPNSEVIDIIDNRFSTIYASTVGDYGPSTSCAGHNLSGNVYHETGLPVTLD